MEYQTSIYSASVRLPATLTCPEQYTGKLPMVLLCHGHSRHKDDGLDVLGQRLLEQGYASLRFNFRGCGRDAENRYALYCMSDWVNDLISAVSYVSGLAFVDTGRIGVAGISMGACTALYVTGMDDRIHSTVSMSGISDCKRWLKGVWERTGGSFDAFLTDLNRQRAIAARTGKAALTESNAMYNVSQEMKDMLCNDVLLSDPESNCFVTADSVASLLEYKPIRMCPYITTPVFFAHGGKDFYVPRALAYEMYDAVQSPVKKIEVYEDVDHNIPIDPNRETVFRDICDWFRETL